jgi:SSS family solute:Na+ symporter
MLALSGQGFGTFDLVFFLGYMAVTLVIGFAVGRREKATVGEYFRAGNTLPWYAIGASIIAAGISSEQFVGEMGYAYKLGMPCVNWEWLIFPALSILMWIFVPLYVRNRVTTMPEYLEKRYGGRARTLYACLIIASYVFANFALVFYTGGFAIEKMWGFNRNAAVWVLAAVTGAYTIYGGLTSVAWTDFFQCALLLGGGIYVFLAGMAKIGWNFGQVLGTGQYSHLIAPASDPDVPWTALIILALSTNVWYYATDQFINQRCLGARNEWHAKMGVLLAGGIQLIIPLATCFPGMVYRVMNPGLIGLDADGKVLFDHSDAAYPSVVGAVVPAGLRGLVVAAVLGAIMSTISGLVNSTSTMVTLDIVQRWKGRDWSERKLVTAGQISGALALVVGAAFSTVVVHWQNMFRYCQDIWAPMAAPAVVVFLGGALWKGARQRGAVVCLWLSILTVPLTFARQMLADSRSPAHPTGIHFLPPSLENSLVFAGVVFLASIVWLVALSLESSSLRATLYSAVACIAIYWLGARQPEVVAVLVGAAVILGIVVFCIPARTVTGDAWDRSMLRLPKGQHEPWYASLLLWWSAVGLCFVGLYWYFW